MATNPVLSDTTAPLGEIRMCTRYSNAYIDVSTQTVDDAHIHSCYEVYMNGSGDVSFLHDSEIYDIQPGDIILSYPADVHHCIYHASCVHEHYCLWFSDETIGTFLRNRGIRGRIRPSAESREHILQLLQALCSADLDPFLRTAYLLELIPLLDSGSRDIQKEVPSGRIRPVLRYIDTHLAEIGSIAEVSQAFFISASTLNRMFRTHLKMSFGKYLEAQRLASAERLLRADYSVTEVCSMCGFRDCSRFILKFKERFGVTPLQYKKRLAAGCTQK